MSITMSLRRKLIAWALTSVGFAGIALGTKWIDGPDWLVFGFVVVALYALVALLLLADGIAAAFENEQERCAPKYCISDTPRLGKRSKRIISSRNVSHETF